MRRSRPTGSSPDEIARAAEKICALLARPLARRDGLDRRLPRLPRPRPRRCPGLYDRALATLETLLDVSRRDAEPDRRASRRSSCATTRRRSRTSASSSTRRTGRTTTRSASIRGDAFDPSLKEDLDVDLYERLSRKIDARYPPDEARTGWRGRADAGAARGQPPPLRVHRPAGEGRRLRGLLPRRRAGVRPDRGRRRPRLRAHRDAARQRPRGRLRLGEDPRERGRRGASSTTSTTRLCRCTHECNARTMILFDRTNALPVARRDGGARSARRDRREQAERTGCASSRSSTCSS